ncbi:hypothetical protein HHI36_020506 [Cryptolaemus montrouzieri]|uniref:HTH psq-type domain-containing protein n=1 Tax=Cryptolaemus montrouzieri TaxID=559131 RepID=A0ABD2NAQ0_9CUCU
MPTKYIRQPGSTRGFYSEDALTHAMVAVRNEMGVNLAARVYNIPSRTLRCLLHNNEPFKKAMEPTGIFGETNDDELKLVAHYKHCRKKGFASTRDDIRSLAFNFVN